MGKLKFVFNVIGWLVLITIGQVIGAIVAIFAMAFTDAEYLDMLLNTEDITPLVTELTNPMLIGGAIIVLIVVIIKISIIHNPNKTWGQKAKDYLNLKPINKRFDYVRYFCLGITINVVISILLNGLYNLLDVDGATSSAFEGTIFTLICISIIVPIVEEILYRNRVYNSLKNLCPRFANFLQALAFGIAHGNPIQIVYTFFFGILFGKINDREKSLLPSIFIHCGINFYAGISILSPGSEIYLIPFAIFALPKIAELIKPQNKNTL